MTLEESDLMKYIVFVEGHNEQYLLDIVFASKGIDINEKIKHFIFSENGGKVGESDFIRHILNQRNPKKVLVKNECGYPIHRQYVNNCYSTQVNEAKVICVFDLDKYEGDLNKIESHIKSIITDYALDDLEVKFKPDPKCQKTNFKFGTILVKYKSSQYEQKFLVFSYSLEAFMGSNARLSEQEFDNKNLAERKEIMAKIYSSDSALQFAIEQLFDFDAINKSD
ncbi:MAG: hypothetical protein M1559_00350 [Candidatus Marsarchaeota archaeon]|nr:hypothetical protein [Candidatus Marsarchaeota archaeon]